MSETDNENDLAAAMGLDTATVTSEESASEETPAERRKRKKREAYAAKKAAEDPEPSTEPEPDTAPRLTAGSNCPKCKRGLIGVVRTRLQRSKNKRTRVLGCRNIQCLWDLDGDNVRENPINAGKPMKP